MLLFADKRSRAKTDSHSFIFTQSHVNKFGKGTIAALTTLGPLAGLAGPAQAFAPIVIPSTSPKSQTTIGLLGARPGQTALPIPISDRISGSLDVATGNLNVSL
ncbi:hypothetical protein [Arthrobacter sp. TMN-50]